MTWFLYVEFAFDTLLFIKYFILYKDGEKVKGFCIMLPKMRGQTRHFDETKCMSFLIKVKS